MGSQINWNSILGKAKECMAQDNMQKRVDAFIDKAVLTFSASPGTLPDPKEAARKFIEVLQAEIKSHAGMEAAEGGLGTTAIEALTKLEYGTPVKTGRNSYQIEVWFAGDLRRDSLDPSTFDGIENIAALLNTGYTAGKTVYGIWLDHYPWNIPSLTHREGARFIEGAIRVFMADYARAYGVVDIEVDDVYK